MTNLKEKALELAYGIEHSDDMDMFERKDQAYILSILSVTYAICGMIEEKATNAKPNSSSNGI